MAVKQYTVNNYLNYKYGTPTTKPDPANDNAIAKSGYNNLENLQVAPLSLITLNEDLFELAFNKGIISANQKDILNKYFEDPEKTMQDFINSHPTFINDVIANGDEKSVKRAKLCLEKGWYTNQ